MSWMSILSKNTEITQKNAKKQPTENQKNTKHQNVSWRGLSFYIYLALPLSVTPLPTGWHSIGRVCGGWVVASHLHSYRFHV